MTEPKAYSVSIGYRAYNLNKSGYPVRPSIYAGMEVAFGAASCSEHPESTTASLSLWVPKTHTEYLPKLDEEVYVRGTFGGTKISTVFAGTVDRVTLFDDHKPAETYDPTQYYGNKVLDINDSLLGHWIVTGDVSLTHTATSIDNGILTITLDDRIVNAYGYHHSTHITLQNLQKFSIPADRDLSVETGIVGATGVVTMYFYNSIGNLLSGKTVDVNTINTVTPPAGATKMAIGDWSIDAKAGYPILKVGPFIVRDPSTATPAPESVPGYRVLVQCSDAVAQAGRLRIGDTPWDSTTAMLRFGRISELAKPAGVKFGGTYGLTVSRGYAELEDVYVRARDVDSVNALEVYQGTAMSGGMTVGSISNVVGPNYRLLMPRVLDKDTNGAFIEEVTNPNNSRPIPAIPVNAIVDDSFSLDTTETINQVKLEYFVRKGTVWSSEPEAVSETNMTISASDAKYAPVTRTLKVENQVNDPYSSLQAPKLDAVNSVMVKATALLAAQSVPRWRLSNGCDIVLKNLPDSEGLIQIIDEETRFGQLIRIDNGPSEIEQYQRIRGGTIVLGANPSLSFQLEPVDYSAPLALTKDAATFDATTASITYADLKKNLGLKINDLRSIGAR